MPCPAGEQALHYEHMSRQAVDPQLRACVSVHVCAEKVCLNKTPTPGVSTLQQLQLELRLLCKQTLKHLHGRYMLAFLFLLLSLHDGSSRKEQEEAMCGEARHFFLILLFLR